VQNRKQPRLEVLYQIAEILKVKVKCLLLEKVTIQKLDTKRENDKYKANTI
jgi:hypothetical protein